MSQKQIVPKEPVRDAQFDRAFAALAELVDLAQADELHPARGNAVYTTSVVLWMLVYQRLNPDASLEAAVKQLLEAKPDFMPRNKRVSEGRLSTNTSSYSRARSRLPREASTWFAAQVSRSLIEATTPSFAGRRVFLVDGTTIALAPELALQREFPPASNQHGEGVWPIALLVVAHELASGAALNPAIGAMYGANAVAETALVDPLLEQMPADSIVMADNNFGIFVVAHRTHRAGHSFVFRMTGPRFESLRRQAELIESGDNFRSYSHQWRPSPKERQNHPELPAAAVIDVRLHEIVVHESLTLYLVTDLAEPAADLADLYKRRYDVEIDIRNLKVVLNAEHIRARSVDTFHKELLASMVSYNLVSQFRRQAADLVGEPPRRMSFKRTWTTFSIFLLSQMYTEAANWRAQYETALKDAMKDKLPNRPGRSYEREAYSKRPKSDQFKIRKRKSIDET